MLNQFAWKIPRYQSTSVIPTSPSSWWNAKPFSRNPEPQKWAAKHLGHTWYIGNVFANPHASSSAPYPQELNQWNSSTEEPLHSSTAEKSERPEQNQDLRCQSGPSAKNSVIFSGGNSSKNIGQTNNDCRFQTFTLTSSLHQSPLLSER